MTLASLVDVNVVLPLLLPQHSAHTAARDWLAERPHASITLWAWPTQLGVLRLLSQPRVMGAAALSPERALDTWNALVEAADFHAAANPPPEHASQLRLLVAGRVTTPDLWTDAWLAALALVLDCDMVTFDRGFQSFAGLKLRLLNA